MILPAFCDSPFLKSYERLLSKKILYEWAESDAEFTTAIRRLKDVQENDPLKTGTEEDYFVNSMMIALLLMETRDRHYKSENH